MFTEEKEEVKRFERLINHIIKQEYPFIKHITLYRLQYRYGELYFELEIYVDSEFIREHVREECYDQMDNDEYYFDLYGYNSCSDIEINKKKLENDVTILFKTSMSPKSIHTSSMRVSIIGLDEGTLESLF